MAKRKSSQKAYFGLDWIVSLILAILPTNLLCGVITRAMRGNWLGLILNIVLFPIFYIVDLVTIIIHKDLTILA
jgi:hypothetical protein